MSATTKYMNAFPELVQERDEALAQCPTKSGRSQLYKEYYLKMKNLYIKMQIDEEHEMDSDDEDEDEDEDDDEEDDPDYDPEAEEDASASETDASETDASETDASETDAETDEVDIDAELDAEIARLEAEAIIAAIREAEKEIDEAASEAEASEADASEADASEADASEADASEAEENEFGCPGCNYEWRDGYKNGWRDAMKSIAKQTHRMIPDTPPCTYCDIVCKTRKCGGACGGIVRYCSPDCQKLDWTYAHKNICHKN